MTQITSLFASSRCRTCYCGRRMDAVWRLRRFQTLLPYMLEVPLESYRRAEDYRANILLDKTSLVADGPSTDKYRLGLTLEARRIYSSLDPAERKSFDEELAALANINSLMQMSRQWENCKDASPALGINLGHQAFQKMRHLRRLNLYLWPECYSRGIMTGKSSLLPASENSRYRVDQISFTFSLNHHDKFYQ